MGKLTEFLMQNTARGASTQVDIAGFPHPFAVKSITQGENIQLQKSCESSYLDKKSAQRCTHFDQDLYLTRLVIASCTEPNFKDAQLQKAHGVMGAEQLVEQLFKPGEFAQLAAAVQAVNGFLQDDNELRDCAKN